MQSMRLGALAATLLPVALISFSTVTLAETGDTELVSLTVDGRAAGDSNLRHGGGALSADGRYVAFYSFRSTLVRDDRNSLPDVFLRDRVDGATRLVSRAMAGGSGNGWSGLPSISDDGSTICYMSTATNLVPGDGNDVADIYVWQRDTGRTTLASVASDGRRANDTSLESAVSADGRYVAFTSLATNLDKRDGHGYTHVFLRDLQAGSTERVTVNGAGVAANDYSWEPSVSADGRFVAFYSNATNLVPGDREGRSDVFVRDRQNGQTHRVSVDAAGHGGNRASVEPVISANGRFVAFVSLSSNLVTGDTNDRVDVFVHDLQSHVTERVSVASDGRQADGASYEPSISADGRYVAFESFATNLVAGDTNRTYDVFVHDRETHRTRRVSVASDGHEADDANWTPSISADGAFVAFRSDAANLARKDANDSSDVYVHAFDRTDEAFTIKPSALDFGSQAVGSAHTEAFWLRNKGETALRVRGFEVRGDGRGAYDVAHTCSTHVAPGDVCAFQVTFHPGSAGTKNATLRVWAGDDALRTRDLLGVGTP